MDDALNPDHDPVPDAERLEQLVERITGPEPLSDAAFAAIQLDPVGYACALELDVIWHLTGTFAPPPSR